MAKLNAKDFRAVVATTVRGSLWLAVLVPILGISAYSFYWIARHWGVPPGFAIAMSTCFDGVALVCADYSLKYAQVGLSGSGPRLFVRAYALLAAYLQAFHARLAHEPPGGWVLWASLPIGAVTVYELHIRWERRKALAKAGVRYPAPLPSFGAVTWLLFPLATLTSLRGIVERRKDAITDSAKTRPALALVDGSSEAATDKPTKPSGKERIRPDNVRQITSAPHAPKRHMRAWLKSHGHKVSEAGRVPVKLQHIHNAECQECKPAEPAEEAT